MSLSRRSALQLFGLATLPSLARAATADASWAAAHRKAVGGGATLFRADERALVSAVADVILPRTETPGALEAGVPAFVEVITAEWMTDEERDEFRTGLAAIDLHALTSFGRAWPALEPPQREQELAWLESVADPGLPARRGYRRLRGLVVHGYLTSERVQKEVLRTEIMPGRYIGCAAIPDWQRPPEEQHQRQHGAPHE